MNGPGSSILLMLLSRDYLSDVVLCVVCYLCVVTIAIVNLELGRYGSLGADNFVDTSRILCPTVTEMCAGLTRGEIYGSIATIQKFCSQYHGDGVGLRLNSANDSNCFWTLLEHPWLLLTLCICTAVLTHLVSGIIRERRALRAERNGGWEFLRLTQERVKNHILVNLERLDPCRMTS